jgi:hypothetical protein
MMNFNSSIITIIIDVNIDEGLDESEILSDLPTSMRTDIALFLNREVVEKVPFFKNASENFINVLVRLLKPQVCAPGTNTLKCTCILLNLFRIVLNIRSVYSLLSSVLSFCSFHVQSNFL